jgi:2-polyprenyl-3-methyl-5-hydroxy-6-metoxy-1,4-benzoquinol methylase
VISSGEPALQHQNLVNARFGSEASHWKDMYEGVGHKSATVGSEVIRDRHAAALAWIDGLALAPGSRVLEVGGGAGIMAVALARRGFRVDAVDASAEMVELTRRNAAEAGCQDLVSASTGDACALPFDDGSYDLVVAIGVISWLAQPDVAVREMARVTRPGGHVLLTAFNQGQLIGLLDPLRNPVWRPLKLHAKRLVERRGLLRPSASLTYHSRGAVDGFMSRAGLVKRQERTLGFGPFTLFQRQLFPAPSAIALHRRLQQLADRGVPGLRATGMFYLVLADKPDATSRLP